MNFYYAQTLQKQGNTWGWVCQYQGQDFELAKQSIAGNCYGEIYRECRRVYVNSPTTKAA